MNILLPWSKISTLYYARKAVGDPFHFYCSVFTLGNPDGNDWRFVWQSIDYSIGPGNYYNARLSFEEAKEKADYELINAGWKLLNEGDKLLSLI